MTLSPLEMEVTAEILRQFARLDPARRIDVAAIVCKIAVIETGDPLTQALRHVTGLDRPEPCSCKITFNGAAVTVPNCLTGAELKGRVDHRPGEVLVQTVPDGTQSDLITDGQELRLKGGEAFFSFPPGSYSRGPLPL